MFTLVSVKSLNECNINKHIQRILAEKKIRTPNKLQTDVTRHPSVTVCRTKTSCTCSVTFSINNQLKRMIHLERLALFCEHEQSADYPQTSVSSLQSNSSCTRGQDVYHTVVCIHFCSSQTIIQVNKYVNGLWQKTDLKLYERFLPTTKI